MHRAGHPLKRDSKGLNKCLFCSKKSCNVYQILDEFILNDERFYKNYLMINFVVIFDQVIPILKEEKSYCNRSRNKTLTLQKSSARSTNFFVYIIPAIEQQFRQLHEYTRTTLKIPFEIQPPLLQVERTKQMEPILRAKVKIFFKSENLKKCF